MHFARTPQALALSALGILACTTVPRSAAAGNFEGGLRSGVSVPGGDLSEGDKLRKNVNLALPIELDLGFRASDQWFVGAYLGAARGLVGSELRDACYGDCSASSLYLGVQAQYHFPMTGPLDFWLGAGLGWEHLSIQDELPGADVSVGYSGWSQLRVQAGFDYELSPFWRFGPFVSVSTAEFTTLDMDCSGPLCESTGEHAEISNSARDSHQWATLGFRVTFGGSDRAHERLPRSEQPLGGESSSASTTERTPRQSSGLSEHGSDQRTVRVRRTIDRHIRARPR